MKLPLCAEVCRDCESGKHVFHILNELGDIEAEWVDVEIRGKIHKRISIHGWADDELWLENLLEMVAFTMNKVNKNVTP